jgi:hypothetical protein
MTMLLQNFYMKLRKHLLPRIQDMLKEEAASCREGSVRNGEASSAHFTPYFANSTDMSEYVWFQNDYIYNHKFSRFHFTTYDIRRGTDIINPDTPRCNIMLLADNADVDMIQEGHFGCHPFLYARVLGVYHANIIYGGKGSLDFQPRHLDFLWVRWYEVINPQAATNSWDNFKLDSLQFLSIKDDDSLDFVDPKDVLHGCHIIPNFAKGKRHPDGKGFSPLAKDGEDYKEYYVGR